MPRYCYRDKRGRIHERVFSIMAQIPKRIFFDDGGSADRDFTAERASVPSARGWPLTCYASGVNASQAGELRDHFQKVGVPTEVTNDGDPVYRDAAHRKKALRARGFVDRKAYC